MPTTAQAGADIHLCETGETVLQANTPVQGLGRWRLLSGQATLSDPTDPQATLSVIGYGQVVLEWSITLEVQIHPGTVSFAVAGDMLLAPEADSYQWYFNGQQIKGATSQKFFVRNTGVYYRLKTITSGCAAFSAPVDLEIHLPGASLLLRPNPATDRINLELAANETGPVSIIIWDQLGRKAGSLMSRKEWTVLEKSLDLGKLNPGLYLLEVRLGKETLTRKFVKQ
jgi:hypothetical protein